MKLTKNESVSAARSAFVKGAGYRRTSPSGGVPLQHAHLRPDRERSGRRHLVAASTLSLAKTEAGMHCNLAGAEKVGMEIARLAKEKNITQVVFDRNGYLYHGRVKAVADGAREGGLEF